MLRRSGVYAIPETFPRHRRKPTGKYVMTAAPLVVQRYAPGPHEVGVFYYRFPHEARGHIFTITEKIFPKLSGDGRSTIAELIQRDPRARLTFLPGSSACRPSSAATHPSFMGHTVQAGRARVHSVAPKSMMAWV